jgi:DNA modification methylase
VNEAPDIQISSDADNAQRSGYSLQGFVPQPFYDRDGITIYCGDNRQILPMLADYDLLLADPPYGNDVYAKGFIGLNHARRGRGKLQGGAPPASIIHGRPEWDKKPVEGWMLEMARAKAKWQIIWGGHHYALPPRRGWLVWDKKTTGNLGDCELAWTNLEMAVQKIEYLWNGLCKQKPEERYHPTQKPLDVMSWSLGFVPEAKTVCDPWMGSGTTLVAAKQLGLRAIGIEADETYCKAAVSRLAQGVLGLGNVDLSHTPSQPK